jgi:hypothetical protein
VYASASRNDVPTLTRSRSGRRHVPGGAGTSGSCVVAIGAGGVAVAPSTPQPGWPRRAGGTADPVVIVPARGGPSWCVTEGVAVVHTPGHDENKLASSAATVDVPVVVVSADRNLRASPPLRGHRSPVTSLSRLPTSASAAMPRAEGLPDIRAHPCARQRLERDLANRPPTAPWWHRAAMSAHPAENPWELVLPFANFGEYDGRSPGPPNSL